MKPVLLIGLLLATTPLLMAQNPVTHQSEVTENLLQPWKAEHWSAYSGIYEALEEDSTGSERIILTAFAGAKDAKLISACRIIVSDLFVEPSYQVHGSITPNVETGALNGYSIYDWKMVRYADPGTKEPVFGISIDGRIYVDRSKSK